MSFITNSNLTIQSNNFTLIFLYKFPSNRDLAEMRKVHINGVAKSARWRGYEQKGLRREEEEKLDGKNQGYSPALY